MSKKMNKLAMIAIAAAAVAVPSLSLAAGFGTTNTQVLTESCSMIERIRSWIFGVVYVLGAIGLVLIAISAFLGRFKFAHLIALGGGLFIVAAADLLIGFVTAGNDTACA